MKRPRLLTFIDWYLPGYRAGGPVRALANLTEALGEEIEFLIITADRDLEDTAAYPGIKVDEWQPLANGQVYYASPGSLTVGRLKRLLNTVPHDALYINSV